MKKILIILSTYNGSKYLDQQLQSIYMQKTDCKINLLVRDDGSEDSTLKILNRWSKNLDIKFIEDNDQLGAAKSFWKLINLVNDADYYAFVDQDDIWEPDKIDTAVKALGNNNFPQLWCSNCSLIDSDGNVIKEKMHVKRPELTVISQIVCGSIQGCSMIFNKATMKAVKKKSISEIPMHDIVFLTYTLAEGEVIFEERPMFKYRLHKNNVVAKSGKGIVKQIKITLQNWFGKQTKNSISNYSKEFVRNEKQMLEDEVANLLLSLGNRKKSLFKKFGLFDIHW